MRYELINRYHGSTILCDSEKSKDHFLASAKKDKKGQIDWSVNRVLDDTPEKPKFTVEELKAMLSDAESYEAPVETKRGRPKKEESNA